MQMDAGKYRGCELSDLPTDYLDWALIHLRLNGPMWDAVMAEQSRRRNAERVAAESSMQRALERPLRLYNKAIARVKLAVTGYLSKSNERGLHNARK